MAEGGGGVLPAVGAQPPFASRTSLTSAQDSVLRGPALEPPPPPPPPPPPLPLLPAGPLVGAPEPTPGPEITVPRAEPLSKGLPALVVAVSLCAAEPALLPRRSHCQACPRDLFVPPK